MGYSPERRSAVLKRMLPPNNMAIRAVGSGRRDFCGDTAQNSTARLGKATVKGACAQRPSIGGNCSAACSAKKGISDLGGRRGRMIRDYLREVLRRLIIPASWANPCKAQNSAPTGGIVSEITAFFANYTIVGWEVHERESADRQLIVLVVEAGHRREVYR